MCIGGHQVKYGKRIVIAICVYVGIVIAFESMLGFFQPSPDSTIVITTQDAGGGMNDRVLSRLDTGGQIYVAANHWPRGWYKQALANPNVNVTIEGETAAYTAVPVTGAEHDRVEGEHSAPIPFRVLTGFPPRYFIRLDARDAAAPDPA
jgi:hypothetical protein